MATVLITGSNRGIGLELCRQYKTRGDRVIAVCRAASEALGELGVEVQAGVDVGSDDDVKALDQKLGDTKLDIVINNAGIMSQETLDDLDFDRVRRQFEINTLAPLRVAVTLRHRLERGAKLAFITSRMGSIADNTSGGSYGYRISKTALNSAATSLARDLSPHGISVAILHPGFVKTDMTGGNGYITAEESAKGLIERIDELSDTTSGGFWHTSGERLPW
ncbi:MAG: SDR family oxidoreductase [Haliangiales bacterium]